MKLGDKLILKAAYKTVNQFLIFMAKGYGMPNLYTCIIKLKNALYNHYSHSIIERLLLVR
jgi:hypothetical protein